MGWVDGTPDEKPPPKTGGGCCRCTARLWLVVFNMLFALLGAGLIVFGYMLRFKSAMFETYILDILTSAEVDGVDLKSILQSVSIVIMLLGFIVMVFGVMGIIGGCCEVKMLLTVYALVMLKIIIIEIVAVILLLVMRDQIDSRVKGALQTTLDTYKGYNSTEPVSIGWNYVFSKLDCCGIDNHKDITNSSKSEWISNANYQGSSYTLDVPIFCCKMDGTYPSMTLPSSLECALTPNSTTSNYMSGCYDAFEDYILSYRLVLYIVGGLIFLCEVISLISAYKIKKTPPRILNIVTAIAVRQGKAADEKKKRKHKRKTRAMMRNNKVTGM